MAAVQSEAGDDLSPLAPACEDCGTPLVKIPASHTCDARAECPECDAPREDGPMGGMGFRIDYSTERDD